MDPTPETRVAEASGASHLDALQLRTMGYQFLERCGLEVLALEEVNLTFGEDGQPTEPPSPLTDWPVACRGSHSVLLKDLGLDEASAEWLEKRLNYRNTIIRYAIKGGLDESKIPDEPEV